MNIILDLDNTIINALADSDRKKLPADFSNRFSYRDIIPFFRIYARRSTFTKIYVVFVFVYFFYVNYDALF